MSTISTGGVVAAAEERKQAKYSSLDHGYSFTQIAIESLGAIGLKSLAFFKELAQNPPADWRDQDPSPTCWNAYLWLYWGENSALFGSLGGETMYVLGSC